MFESRIVAQAPWFEAGVQSRGTECGTRGAHLFADALVDQQLESKPRWADGSGTIARIIDGRRGRGVEPATKNTPEDHSHGDGRTAMLAKHAKQSVGHTMNPTTMSSTAWKAAGCPSRSSPGRGPRDDHALLDYCQACRQDAPARRKESKVVWAGLDGKVGPRYGPEAAEDGSADHGGGGGGPRSPRCRGTKWRNGRPDSSPVCGLQIARRRGA